MKSRGYRSRPSDDFIMTAKLNPVSKATKAKSLVAAVIITVGLQGALLWQVNEVANAGAQSAVLAARASATGTSKTTSDQTGRLTLKPVTIVARRLSRSSELCVASAAEQAASSVVDRALGAIPGRTNPVSLC